MELSKAVFSQLNEIAQSDFERAQAMLDGINLALGTEYGWLNKRVTFFDDNTTAVRKYATAHDAWVNAKDSV